jgi:MFS family permease
VTTHAPSFLDRLLRNSPLRNPQFRLYYTGSIAVAMGYTIQSTIAAWLMATLTPSTLMVALVQTASTLPTLLFGLAAGALADIVDRRRIMLVTQVGLIALSVMIGVAELLGQLGPIPLLIGTFLFGFGFTFYMPAQQANVNDLVARADLPQALALGSVSFNLSRAVGPALAGTIAAILGSGSAFLASALLFTWMIYAIVGLKPRERAIPGVADTLFSGMKSGLRYARHSPPMRALIGRTFSFSLCASGMWALLPVIARDQLKLDAGGFGMLSASFGIGAVVWVLGLQRRLSLPLNTLVAGGHLLWMSAILLIAFATHSLMAMVGCFAAGAAWVAVLPALSAGIQSTAPGWVRARAVAMNLVAMQASLALGSVIWGWVASHLGLGFALATSSGAMAVLYALTYRVKVRMGDEADVTPGSQLPDFSIAVEPLPDDGPVLIQVQYQIDPKDSAAFLRAIHANERSRRRNGVSDWRVFRDLGAEGRYVERFIVTSWAEYVRLRSRMTVADQQAQDRVEAFLLPGTDIVVTRLLSTRPEGHVENTSNIN